MYAIIKNIPDGITAEKLAELIQPVVKGKFFQKTGKLQAIKILQIIDQHGGPLEYHALVRVCADPIKLRLIRSLDCKLIGNDENANISVSEFVVRHWSNDRRSNSRQYMEFGQNRRVADRRRYRLKFVTQAELHFVENKPTKVATLVDDLKEPNFIEFQ